MSAHLPDMIGDLTSARPAQATGAVATYVSLFLILFVFFIVLFTVSASHHARRMAVLTGLDAAFGHVPSTLGLLPVGTDAADPATLRFVQDINRTLSPFTGMVHAEAPPGIAVSLTMAPGALFTAATAKLTTAAAGRLDQLAVLLQRHQDQGRYRLVWRNIEPDRGSAEAELATARATAVAAYLYAHGCPPDALTLAVSNGATALRLDFLATGDER